VRDNSPKKRAGIKTGPRRLNGDIMDVATMARDLGATEKTIRAKVARGLLPHRRLGSRIVFLRDEVQAYLCRLPGVSVDEALANTHARAGR